MCVYCKFIRALIQKAPLIPKIYWPWTSSANLTRRWPVMQDIIDVSLMLSRLTHFFTFSCTMIRQLKWLCTLHSDTHNRAWRSPAKGCKAKLNFGSWTVEKAVCTVFQHFASVTESAVALPKEHHHLLSERDAWRAPVLNNYHLKREKSEQSIGDQCHFA